jgi:hypothetical protein
MNTFPHTLLLNHLVFRYKIIFFAHWLYWQVSFLNASTKSSRSKHLFSETITNTPWPLFELIWDFLKLFNEVRTENR